MKSSFLLLATALILSNFAQADDELHGVAAERFKSGTGALVEHKNSHPCLADIEMFCKGIEPGEGRILNCLKENEASLSPSCKAAGDHQREEMTAKVKEKAGAVRDACGDDFKKYCKDVKGPAKRMKCLKSHEAELSDGCKSSFSKKGP